MASIANDSGGRRRILFIAADGKRRTLRLGKATAKQAEAVKVRIEPLRKHRWPRRLPRPSAHEHRGDWTRLELFAAGVAILPQRIAEALLAA